MTTAVIGPVEEHEQQLLRVAILRADPDVQFFADESVARAELLDGAVRASLRCVFVHRNTPSIRQLLSALRGDGRMFAVPVVMLVDRPADRTFCEAHSLGADDVVLAHDDGAITRRVANLDDFDPQKRPPPTQGTVAIAHSNGERRRVLGRVMRQAGFNVAFAQDREELVEVCQNAEPVLAVVEAAFPPGGAAEALQAVRERIPEGLSAIVLHRASTPEAPSIQEFGPATAATSELAPADNLLFLANELLRPEVQNVRASQRLLFGSICAFRRAGEFEAAYGLTYNISGNGLYVRTLDPPVRESKVWFEMRPPYDKEAVHLRGTVMWRRGLTSPGGSAPPGFGLRIDFNECPDADAEKYSRAYRALLEQPRLFHYE